jgi:lipoyl(octanoyl) transferase
VIARRLGLVAYEPTWRAMQSFNTSRDEATADQLWLVQHPPVFTLGLAGRREHVLAGYGIDGRRRAGMPGVYVAEAKIAAIGLRVARGCCYHGVALNVDMDLEPFARIDPCGYPGLAATQLRDHGAGDSIDAVHQRMADTLVRVL